MKSFGDRLREFRKASGLTQEQVALEVGISKSAVSAWELDVSEPSIAALRVLRQLFGVSLDELVGEVAAKAGDALVLSAKERHLIQVFRALPPKRRAAVIALLEQ